MAKKGSADKADVDSGADAIVRANVKRTIVFAPNFISLYTNDTQVQVSPWDVRLIFGEISEPPTSERPEVVIKATGEVRMSPQHAKRILQILADTLATYERSVGPIPLPVD
ncbi:MAG TPA: DUF3467 domain-containing protein [Methylomirabilota bacterium]|jgi:hypothetical protein|nr:DUF3467 domain-containing protein [Methylomirabilota bacterium]